MDPVQSPSVVLVGEDSALRTTRSSPSRPAAACVSLQSFGVESFGPRGDTRTSPADRLVELELLAPHRGAQDNVNRPRMPKNAYVSPTGPRWRKTTGYATPLSRPRLTDWSSNATISRRVDDERLRLRLRRDLVRQWIPRSGRRCCPESSRAPQRPSTFERGGTWSSAHTASVPREDRLTEAVGGARAAGCEQAAIAANRTGGGSFGEPQTLDAFSHIVPPFAVSPPTLTVESRYQVPPVAGPQ